MFATIYVPNFYLQAVLRHHAPSPATAVGLIDEKNNKPVIIQLNPVAVTAGVLPGMTPSQGLARCLSLVIKVRSAAQEESTQEILLHSAFTLSPYVEDTGPGVCTVQFTDHRSLVEKVSRAIAHLGECEIIAQGGIGRTPDTSFLAAHLARPVVAIEEPKKFLTPLPIETLTIGLESWLAASGWRSIK
jgi:hypothetical protein